LKKQKTKGLKER